jgi:hypothetical protein
MLPGSQHNNVTFDSFQKVDDLKAFFAERLKASIAERSSLQTKLSVSHFVNLGK